MSEIDKIKLEKQEYKFLDSIDILSIIESKELYNSSKLMKYIDDKYNSSYIRIQKEYPEYYNEDEFIFNYIDESDFVEYLKLRYKDKLICREIITYHLDTH